MAYTHAGGVRTPSQYPELLLCHRDTPCNLFCPGISLGLSLNLAMISCITFFVLLKFPKLTYAQPQQACTILGELQTYRSLVEPR